MNKANHHGLRRIGEDVLALTAGAGAGAGLMYLCDPKRGRARRRLLAAEAIGVFHRDKKTFEKRGKDLLNRVRGVMAEATSALASPEEQVADDVLVQRVRSRMGHVLPHPHEIGVKAHEGVVTLEGKMRHAERRRLLKAVAEVAGVKHIHDRLTSPFRLNPGILLGIAAGLTLFRKIRAQQSEATDVAG